MNVLRTERAVGGAQGVKWVLGVKCDNRSLHEEVHKVADEFKWW